MRHSRSTELEHALNQNKQYTVKRGVSVQHFWCAPAKRVYSSKYWVHCAKMMNSIVMGLGLSSYSSLLELPIDHESESIPIHKDDCTNQH